MPTTSESPSDLLSGRRALVTGGGTGIGLQFAETLAGLGASVVICGRRAEPLESAASAIATRSIGARSIGGGTEPVVPIPADVTSEEDRQRLVRRAGEIDILVNNAGYARLGPWETVPVGEWREVMNVNVEAPFCLAQLLVPSMIERGWGRVVNVASVYGMVAGNPYFYPDFDWDAASYVTSKHALIGLTKYLAIRTGGTGVTVNALSPGMFPDTEANRDMCSAESRRRLGMFTPERRTGDVEDLSSALTFLISPASGFVTGQNIVVDGGWTIW
jgi:NAD(P)-dependent dehydrogenase (short-subunit alcohol dehydrogenase family)